MQGRRHQLRQPLLVWSEKRKEILPLTDRSGDAAREAYQPSVAVPSPGQTPSERARNHAPAHAADAITRAVYANDYDTAFANFDDATKKTITRSEIGELSDRMHALGE